MVPNNPNKIPKIKKMPRENEFWQWSKKQWMKEYIIIFDTEKKEYMSGYILKAESLKYEPKIPAKINTDLPTVCMIGFTISTGGQWISADSGRIWEGESAQY